MFSGFAEHFFRGVWLNHEQWIRFILRNCKEFEVKDGGSLECNCAVQIFQEMLFVTRRIMFLSDLSAKGSLSHGPVAAMPFFSTFVGSHGCFIG